MLRAHILREEIDMATWLSERLPEIVVAYLERSAAERSDAKR